MKTLYVPKNTVMRHETVDAEKLVVKGMLIVTGAIRAKKILGDGIIIAERIMAQEITADNIDVDFITTRKIIANQIFCMKLTASIGVIARDYIAVADKAQSPRITMTYSDIKCLESNEMIRLTPKRRGFLRLLFVSWLTEKFTTWRNDRITAAKAFEAPPKVDAETERTLEEYRHMCTKGYRLVLESVEPTAVEKSA